MKNRELTTAAEMQVAQVKPSQDRHAGQHQRATDPYRRRRQPPTAQRQPKGDQDGVDLGQKGRGGRRGVLEAIVLKHHPAHRE
jgi:hypothetical protein